MPNDKAREYNLLRRYGLTPEMYQALFDRQEGRCAVCLKHQNDLKLRLAVDHIHKGERAGEVRGLLCGFCNHRVVGRHTDPELLRRVADYLERGTGWFVPKNPPKRRKRRGKTS